MYILKDVLPLLAPLLKELYSEVRDKLKSREELREIVEKSISDVPNAEEGIKQVSPRFQKLVRENQDVEQLAVEIFRLMKEKTELKKASPEETKRVLNEKFNLKIEKLPEDNENLGKIRKLIPVLNSVYDIQKTIEPGGIEELHEAVKEVEVEEASSEELYREWILNVVLSLKKREEDFTRFLNYIMGEENLDKEIQSPSFNLDWITGKKDIPNSLLIFMNPVSSNQEIEKKVEKIRKKYHKRAEDVISGLYATRELIFYSYYMIIFVLLLKNKKFIQDKTERKILNDINEKTKN